MDRREAYARLRGSESVKVLEEYWGRDFRRIDIPGCLLDENKGLDVKCLYCCLYDECKEIKENIGKVSNTGRKIKDVLIERLRGGATRRELVQLALEVGSRSDRYVHWLLFKLGKEGKLRKDGRVWYYIENTEN